MDYPAVSVSDAPGYEDFTGWLLSGPNDWPFWVVGFEWEGKTEFAVVPAASVTLT